MMHDPESSIHSLPPDQDRTLLSISRIVLIYALFATLWILLSDKVVRWLFSDPAQIILASTFKGWLFVGVTSLLLYGLLRRLPDPSGLDIEALGGPTTLFSWQRWQVYLFAVAVTLAMHLVRTGISGSLDERPQLLFFMFPIILSAVLGGLGPGLVATMVAAASTAYFLPPHHEFWIAQPYDLFPWTVLIVNGLFVSVLSEVLHKTRQQAEASRQLQAVTLASIGDGVIRTDSHGRITFLNPEAEQLTGWTCQQALGQQLTAVFRIINEQTREPAGDPSQKVMACGKVVGLASHTVLLARDGREIPVHDSAAPIRTTNGTVLGVVLVFGDDTQRRKAESALQEERDRNQRYLDTVQTLMINLDAHGQITMINRRGCELLGYKENELLGRMWFTTCLPQPQGMETVYPLFQQIMNGYLPAAEYVENPVLCRDGSQRLIAWHNSYYYDDEGRVLGTLSSGEDITEKKSQSQELDRYSHHLEELVETRTTQLAEARKRAEVANLAKGSFLANMSHEIRTPMNAIVGLTHLLQRDNRDPEQQDKLAKITGAAHHLLTIVNDILDLSKIEAGRLQLEVTNFSLDTVIDHALSLIAEEARSKGITITVDTDNAPRWLRGDVTRLGQALLNYAGNAVKFTEHGSIALRVRLLAERDNEVQVRFEVQDSGIGITAELLPSLFQAFEQADVSTTRQYGGTGLGLAITSRLAHLMGGETGAESKPGRGSTFWFTAWLGRGHGIMKPPPALTEVYSEATLRRRHTGARLLLAEDDAINREVALELLHGAGLEVDTAQNGREAVEKAILTAYDLILMDMQMPEMDGLEATRVIRLLPNRTKVPILAMTANAFSEHRQTCLTAGMNDFISKPVDPEILFAVLSKWLPPQTYPPPAALAPETMISDERDGHDLLGHIPGLDPTLCLENLCGNISQYVQLLRQFALAHRDDGARLTALLSTGNFQQGRDLAHGLKGVAATMGATRVRGLAAQLEIALKEQRPASETDPLLKALTQEQALLTAAILALPEETTDSPDIAGPDPVRLQQIVTELQGLLAEDNGRASLLLRESAPLLRAALGARFNELSQQIEEFNFEAALSTLQAITSSTNPPLNDTTAHETA